MEKRMPGILSLAALTVGFLVINFPLYGLHHMKDWPFCLFLVGAIIIAVFGILLSNKIISVFTAIGYILGFSIGYIFQYDYGRELNSMWLIWTYVYLAFILAGVICTVIIRKRRKNKRN